MNTQEEQQWATSSEQSAVSNQQWATSGEQSAVSSQQSEITKQQSIRVTQVFYYNFGQFFLPTGINVDVIAEIRRTQTIFKIQY